MKRETLQKINDLKNAGRIEFTETAEGLAVNYNLSDEELRGLVEIEYGQTTQDVVQLFSVMCKKLVKAALE